MQCNVVLPGARCAAEPWRANIQEFKMQPELALCSEELSTGLPGVALNLATTELQLLNKEQYEINRIPGSNRTHPWCSGAGTIQSMAIGSGTLLRTICCQTHGYLNRPRFILKGQWHRSI